MIYKQYTSNQLNYKSLPKNGEIIQLSIQSRPGTFVCINENKESIKKIGEVGVLELDNISLKKHIVNNKEEIFKIQIIDQNMQDFFEGALIDILYNTTKEEDTNLES